MAMAILRARPKGHARHHFPCDILEEFVAGSQFGQSHRKHDYIIDAIRCAMLITARQTSLAALDIAKQDPHRTVDRHLVPLIDGRKTVRKTGIH